MTWDETHRVETPENVDFEYRLAGIGTRFGAAALDTLIQAAILIAILLLITAAIPSLGGSHALFDPRGWDEAAGWVIAVYLIIVFLVMWGYYVFFETVMRGQTPGKRAVGLRVVKRNGTPIHFGDSIVRNLVRFVDFMPVLYGIGIITMIATRRSQRLGDLAADTVVVIEGRRESFTANLEAAVEAAVVTKSVPPHDPATAGANSAAPAAAVALDNRTLELLDRYFERRWTLEPTAQVTLASRIASPLRERVTELSAKHADDDAFLEALYAAARGASPEG
ncbi:MAG: RDD family protein [Deltaproteobacteria bacterium]|nr:RDD family protein [Deltaproteobacteria bacterium]